MRMLKNDKGKVIGVSMNSEPARKRPEDEKEIITTANLGQIKAKRAAAAKIEADKKAAQNEKA